MKFNLNQTVVMDITGDHGKVLGRAEYVASESSYYIFYKDSRNIANKEWWEESMLSAGPEIA